MQVLNPENLLDLVRERIALVLAHFIAHAQPHGYELTGLLDKAPRPSPGYMRVTDLNWIMMSMTSLMRALQ